MANLKHKKLYQLTSQNFHLPVVADPTAIKVLPADNIPAITWPDGHWCFYANAFMLNLYNNGLSRNNSGGTLKSYACNISHLLRYCHFNQVLLDKISDSHFTIFVNGLSAERDLFGNPVRTANCTVSIGRTCLEFLSFIGTLQDNPEYISPEGRIRAHLIKVEYSIGSVRRITHSWHHHSFPLLDPFKKRFPVSTTSISSLLRATNLTTSKFLAKRDATLIKVLIALGARRNEAVRLKCSDFLKAEKMKNPYVRVPNSKLRGQGPTYRTVPISKADALFICTYIKIYRAQIINKTIGKLYDHGLLFVNENTGQALKPNTVTSEIHRLSKLASIGSTISPHMFRHRFITDMFITLMLAHKQNNADKFRQLLIDVETLKQHVQQWTGHRNLSSLDRYIHLAADEIANLGSSLRLAMDTRFIVSLRVSLQKLCNDLSQGLSKNEAIEELRLLISALDDEGPLQN